MRLFENKKGENCYDYICTEQMYVELDFGI